FDKLERFGLTDALTQVNNRRYFDARLKEAVSHALRHQQVLTAMMFDLDYFKQVNDQYGHQVGDSVLQQAANLMQSCLRGSDSFARYGGEEFVALLPGADAATALEIAERIRASIANTLFAVPNQPSLSLTISIGLSAIELHEAGLDEAATAQALVRDADTALYQAKLQGRNRVIAA
ncbi:MAG: GGDEF domain-containing protein, partial [Sulfuriferula sp.]